MGTNVLAAWGVNFWNQNTSYDEKNAEWPPMMGASQPHWKYFHRYADLIRRISYMNDGGRHVADVLLYRPIASVVAFSDPAFDSAPRHWKGRAARRIRRVRKPAVRAHRHSALSRVGRRLQLAG